MTDSEHASHASKPVGLAEIVEEPGLGARAKVVEWLSRYGFAECAGVTCALLASFVARHLTKSPIVAAYAGAWGETLGYSGVVITRDIRAEARLARARARRVGPRDVRTVATQLLAEFGPSGVLDTMLVRPFAMAFGARLLGPQRGLIVGKLAADVVFYLPVIFMYERGKRRRSDARRERS